MQRDHPRARRKPKEASAVTLKKQLWIVAGLALLGGGVVGTVSVLETRSSTSPQNIVVYRLHGCSCAFPWIDSLQAAGLTVHVVERRSLAADRAILQTPPNLHGCHVATYLNYFVEGHVAPAALRLLADKHPTGIGITTAESAGAEPIHTSVAEEEHSLVLLVEPSGLTVPWFQPARALGD
jgi:hypothetical protein